MTRNTTFYPRSSTITQILVKGCLKKRPWAEGYDVSLGIPFPISSTYACLRIVVFVLWPACPDRHLALKLRKP